MTNHREHAIVTIDALLFTIRDGRLSLALVERGQDPFAGRPALIGGFVHPDEDATALEAVQRILRDKAGVGGMFVEQLATFAGRDRDPRGWSVSIAYYALVPAERLSGASAALTIVPVDERPPLAFDHDAIVAAAVARLRAKGAYSSLPAFLLPGEFTLPELKAVYEIVMAEPLNDSAFRRKIAELGILEPVEDARSPATALRKRPAQLYRLRGSSLVEFDRLI